MACILGIVTCTIKEKGTRHKEIESWHHDASSVAATVGKKDTQDKVALYSKEIRSVALGLRLNEQLTGMVYT